MELLKILYVAAQFAGGESRIPGGATGNFGSEGRQQVTAPYDDRSGAVGGGNASGFQQVCNILN